MTPICNLLSLPPSSSLPFLLPPPLSYLPLIQGTLVDGAFAWSSPLIDSLVRPDVTNTIGIHLHTHTHKHTIILTVCHASSFTAYLDESIVPQTGACKGGCGP